MQNTSSIRKWDNMAIILFITTVLAISVALYYESKAKEFESLFELSKNDGFYGMDIYEAPPPKLNKDGSIAKKRGRKPSNAK